MSTDKSLHPDSHSAIIRSSSVIAAGTLASRILGFIRDVILARILGTGVRADAFFVAFKIPNLLRDLVGEGATNSAVVPVFSEYLIKKERQEFWNFVSVIFAMGLITLSALTILGMIFAPLIVKVIAPGFAVETGKMELTIRLTRIMFPYLILIGVTAYSMAVLYSFKMFTVPAFSPCLLNLAMIVSALASPFLGVDPVYALAVGTLVGGALQLFVQQRALAKTGMKFRWPKTFRHPGAEQVGRLFLPRLFGSGIYQITVLVDTFCASLAHIVGPGGVSALYYSNRIIQFPMGIFSLSMASAALPTMSTLFSTNDLGRLKKTIVFSLENNFFIMFPTGILTIILAEPIVRILFQRGEFDAYSTVITSGTLLFYGFGLFSFGGVKMLVAVFYALQDTKTPVKVAALCLFINVVLDFVLIWPMKVMGIAMAGAVAATVNFLILFYLLDKRLGGFNAEFRNFIAKVLFATTLTGVAVWEAWAFWHFPSELVKFAVVGSGGIVFYQGLCGVLGVEQARKILNWVFRRG
ncbi:MAG: murein biosynthesis integral membrane protein MurJ [Candidatus Omnitrophota bacterium]|nr:murein biosynthesis integral membrane protein MurJ [Candidatus Omnitrophota bacterium]MDZ4242169.1 murein biosynthesis integral membrane protein MurJ [Candidatus Omnitrophota bacterium]